MKHTYRVSGMKCDGCAKTVSDKLSSVMGVDEVNVDLTKNQVVCRKWKNIQMSFKTFFKRHKVFTRRGHKLITKEVVTAFNFLI